MNAEINKYLLDISVSIGVIEQHLANIHSLSDYKNDIKTIDAVERRLAIIGEALKKADNIHNQLNVSNKTKIIGLRNILTHDYDLIEDETIWIICKKYLPILKEEVEALLD
jgi:uncharacterized protein with HEPN domain